jgi:hypothetical protein
VNEFPFEMANEAQLANSGNKTTNLTTQNSYQTLDEAKASPQENDPEDKEAQEIVENPYEEQNAQQKLPDSKPQFDSSNPYSRNSYQGLLRMPHNNENLPRIKNLTVVQHDSSLPSLRRQNMQNFSVSPDLNTRDITKYFECMRRRDPILSNVELCKILTLKPTKT